MALQTNIMRNKAMDAPCSIGRFDLRRVPRSHSVIAAVRRYKDVQMTIALLRLGVAILIASMYGCATTKTKRIDAPEAMATALERLIRPGMTIEEIETAMKSEGFTCTVERQSSFIEMRTFRDKEPRHDGIDFVRCRRTNSGGFMMARLWSVAVLLDGDRSTGNILVSHYIDGP